MEIASTNKNDFKAQRESNIFDKILNIITKKKIYEPSPKSQRFVIPAYAGISYVYIYQDVNEIPAYAGMTLLVLFGTDSFIIICKNAIFINY